MLSYDTPVNNRQTQAQSSRPLAGKTAVVTGASGGIGHAIARRLANDGAAVVVHYNSREQPADALVSDIAAALGTAVAVKADLTRSGEVESLFSSAIERFGGVDIVVANAGISAKPAPLAQVTEADFDNVLNANAKATFLVLRAAAINVAAQGRIVVIGSSTTVHPAAGFGVYAASKAPALMLAPILAAELASRGVTVNVVAAGPTDAGFLDHWTAEDKAKLASASPFGRIGTPEDTADVVAFLASENARWLSGQVLVANGAASV